MIAMMIRRRLFPASVGDRTPSVRIWNAIFRSSAHASGGALWAVEIKRSLTPRPERGFHRACADLAPARRFVVYPGDESDPLTPEIQAIPLPRLARLLAETTP